MLDVAAWMVLRDDEYYVDMAIKSVLPFVKGIYIQDQMSVDGGYEKILELQKREYGNKIVVERVDTGTPVRFHPNYNEPLYRTMAIHRAEEIFSPKWMLRIDADDIFTEYFFKRIESLLVGDPQFEGVRVCGDRPISKDYWATEGANELGITQWSPEGGRFGDPHTQLWKAGKYYFNKNPAMTGFFHCILTPDPQPVYWLPGLCNFHLHRLFGPKAYAFWHEGHDMYGLDEVIDDSKPLYPPTSCPQWFNHKINKGTAEKRLFAWPDYILEKWEKWEGGIW
jgi:hypothetical protein